MVAAICALPSVAAADNFTVDTLEDVHLVTTSCTATPGDCSLRDAILHADATESTDEIDFAVAGTIQIREQEDLPAVEEPVRINAATAPGYVGAPVITLDGNRLSGTTEAAPEIGLLVQSAGVEINGVAMVDFETGVLVSEGNIGLCGDFLGTDASGTAAKPNRIGVRIAAGAEFSTIGAGCEQNVISNNRKYGILDEGIETSIRNNLVGATPDGSGALPNGSEGGPGAGVFVGPPALNSFIGGGGEGGPPNTIAHNDGPGVIVASGAKSTTIFSNAIFDNGDPGIVRELPTKAPAAPILTSLEGSVLKGTVTGQNGGGVVLQFFASRACDGSGSGEGEDWLELEKLVATGSGPVPFEVTLPEHEAGEPVITATSTSFGPVSDTSQFSNCVRLPAQTFTVDTLKDVHLTTTSCTAAPGDCSLRDAILHANATESIDAIDFAVAGTIEVAEGEALPSLSEPVRIDGTSAPGYIDAPVVTVDGARLEGTTEGAPETGLQVQSEGVVIEGLALVAFEAGIVLGEGHIGLCGDYLGTDASGAAGKPNQIGVRVAVGTELNSVGAGCSEPNVISNNREYGIRDEGVETHIGNNSIGTTPDGLGALPNGTGSGPGAGIFVGQFSSHPFIGGGGGVGPPNTIAHNDGSGIWVHTGAIGVTIHSNSIFENLGLGIERELPSAAPAPPSLTGLEGLKVKGSMTTIPSREHPTREYYVQFYASSTCDPSGAGEGETSLEFERTVRTDGDGVANFEFTLPVHSANAPVITATATSGTDAETSVFSNCVSAPPVPSVVSPIGPRPPLGPVNGVSFLVEPVSGTVLVKNPGEKSFHDLVAGELIPVGSIVDATKGKVRLTSVDASGKVQSAVFYGGVFKVDQKAGGTLVVLKLIGSIGPCPTAGASAIASKSGSRQLWGSGKGNFRTEGKYGAATVRGTIWLTADRCSGTFFKVKRGVVAIRDFANRKGVTLKAGDTYLASPG